jgi:hypothetical protein
MRCYALVCAGLPKLFDAPEAGDFVVLLLAKRPTVTSASEMDSRRRYELGCPCCAAAASTSATRERGSMRSERSYLQRGASYEWSAGEARAARRLRARLSL